jgi:hypothetical protein
MKKMFKDLGYGRSVCVPNVERAYKLVAQRSGNGIHKIGDGG